MSVPVISIFCIDYRFDAMLDVFYKNIGLEYNYYACTTAGSALCLGYKKYCSQQCNCAAHDSSNFSNKNKEFAKNNKKEFVKNNKKECTGEESTGEESTGEECGCNPNDSSMVTLKRSIVENINIALSLKDSTEIFMINHQDCGAIRAFLSCSGYPDYGENNKKEIEINSKLLIYAVKYMKKKFPTKKYILGLIDINGTVAYFDAKHKIWTVIYIGKFNEPLGLWYGKRVGDTYKLK